MYSITILRVLIVSLIISGSLLELAETFKLGIISKLRKIKTDKLKHVDGKLNFFLFNSVW